MSIIKINQMKRSSNQMKRSPRPFRWMHGKEPENTVDTTITEKIIRRFYTQSHNFILLGRIKLMFTKNVLKMRKAIARRENYERGMKQFEEMNRASCRVYVYAGSVSMPVAIR
jgi:hypothetical protein